MRKGGSSDMPKALQVSGAKLLLFITHMDMLIFMSRLPVMRCAFTTFE